MVAAQSVQEGKKTRTMCFKKERKGQMEEDKDKVDKWFAMSQAYPRKRNRHTHTHTPESSRLFNTEVAKDLFILKATTL